mgnify:CR=1 FL=1
MPERFRSRSWNAASSAEQESAEELLEHFYDLAAQYIRLLYFARYRNCFSCLRKANTEVEATLMQFSFNGAASEEAPSWEIITDQRPLYEQMCPQDSSHPRTSRNSRL